MLFVSILDIHTWGSPVTIDIIPASSSSVLYLVFQQRWQANGLKNRSPVMNSLKTYLTNIVFSLVAMLEGGQLGGGYDAPRYLRKK